MTKQQLQQYIHTIADFPRPGIQFRDITPLLTNPKAFQAVIDILAERYADKSIDVICGLEARGFIFGAALAYKMGYPFVPIRKPGKLPAKILSASYKKEYGTDSFEMHADVLSAGHQVLIVDDVIATGGTGCAAIELIEKSKASVVELACLIELDGLNGREKLSAPLFSILRM